VARPWRLRHKLLLGLLLVLTCLGVLGAGSYWGLASYVGTMNTTDSKVAELSLLEEFKAAVSNLISPNLKATSTTESPEQTIVQEERRVQEQFEAIEESFGRYRLRFEDTVRRRRDPDPYQEEHLIPDVEKQLRILKQTVHHELHPSGVQVVERTPSLAASPEVMNEKLKLIKLVDELRSAIHSDLYQKIDSSRRQYKTSIAIIVGASSATGILILALVHLFKIWLFRPIRELQAGVRRVYQGDFEQPIQLHSSDELEELANALNDTHRKLHESNQDLEKQVHERSRQLVRSERMVSVGFLAAGVAHEINNPLASIAFCSEALQSRLSDYFRDQPKDTEVIQKYLRMIHQEAFRCKGITGKLLEFSRAGERRREVAELGELIQSVLEIAQHLQSCRGKRIIYQPLGKVYAGVNAEDVKSVVLNLVVNALDSMDEGGSLTITLQQRGEQTEMTFTDTGCGMTQETLDNIFEPFYTRNRTGKGTGLGLFISHHIIDTHGGEIRAISSGLGQGSTFTVRLPIQPGQVGVSSTSKDASQEPRPEDVLPFDSGRWNSKKDLRTREEEGLGHAAA
jgi:two-component system, NtrC family, sensor kinase